MEVTEDNDSIEMSSLFCRDELEMTIANILEGKADSAIFLGHLLLAFRTAIDRGLSGINRTRETLTETIDLIYLHSPEHLAALSLYRLYLAGELLVRDEPLRLINDAIERTNSRLAKDSVRAKAK